MVDICRAEEQRDKYMPLFASPSENNCFNMFLYQSGELPIPIPGLISDKLDKKLSFSIQNNARRRIANFILISARSHWTKHVTWYKIGRRL